MTNHITIIINDPPYGNERLYNALRLANSLLKREDTYVTVFLMGDAVAGAMSGQKTPDGFYNIERMLKPVSRRGEVLLCGTCMDARGIKEENIVNLRLFCDKPQSPRWQIPFQNGEILYPYNSTVISIPCMKMRRVMIAIKYGYNNPEKPANLRHFIP